MKVHDFLLHHGIGRNPFAQEDADSDRVFKQHCIGETYHPAWGKIFGNPEEPSTSAVFGEKGSGKSALRLQIAERLRRFNREHPDERVFVIEYDDFNPYLDRLSERAGGWRRNGNRSLPKWRLWDHMDAILSLGITRLADEITRPRRKHDSVDEAFRVAPRRLAALSKGERRDLLLLAALYDQSKTLPPRSRWQRLRRRVRFRTWPRQWDFALGVLSSVLALSAAIYWKGPAALLTPWPWLAVVAGWLPQLWRWMQCSKMAWQVQRELRVVNRQVDVLRYVLLKMGESNLQNQPIPRRNQSVDRYELLKKFRAILNKLGFRGVTILVDRVDEPHLLGGSPERMRQLIWPLLDNKFLTHPGIGVKLLLPLELTSYLAREDKAFFEKSRLDKHNLVRSLEWTGQSLYDVASDRLNACQTNGARGGRISLRDLFEPELSESDLISALGQLRVPRHLFKFLHRLIVEHCARFTDDNPSWQFSPETFRACHALYLHDLKAFDRGLATV